MKALVAMQIPRTALSSGCSIRRQFARLLPDGDIEIYNRLPSSVPDYTLAKLKNHAKLLAEMIPPLSSPAGGKALSGRKLHSSHKFDLRNSPFKDADIWPETRPGKSDDQQTYKRWLHGDYKDAPYRLTHKLYEKLTKISE